MPGTVLGTWESRGTTAHPEGPCCRAHGGVCSKQQARQERTGSRPHHQTALHSPLQPSPPPLCMGLHHKLITAPCFPALVHTHMHTWSPRGFWRPALI